MQAYHKNVKLTNIKYTCYIHLLDSNHQLVDVLGFDIDSGGESQVFLEYDTQVFMSKLFGVLCKGRTKHDRLYIYISDECNVALSLVDWVS